MLGKAARSIKAAHKAIKVKRATYATAQSRLVEFISQKQSVGIHTVNLELLSGKLPWAKFGPGGLQWPRYFSIMNEKSE